jgi:hypothetical protein
MTGRNTGIMVKIVQLHWPITWIMIFLNKVNPGTQSSIKYGEEINIMIFNESHDI